MIRIVDADHCRLPDPSCHAQCYRFIPTARWAMPAPRFTKNSANSGSSITVRRAVLDRMPDRSMAPDLT